MHSSLKIKIFQFAEGLFGKSFVRNLYARFSISLYKRKHVIFIHIPKNGGSSIAYSIYGRRVGHLYAAVVKRLMGDELYDSFFSFTIARLPYDRLVSAYHYAIQGGTVHGSIRNPDLYHTQVFKSFRSFVLEWLQFQNLADIDVIFRPQYLFLTDTKGNKLVQFIANLENLEVLEIELKKQNIELKLTEAVNASLHDSYKNYYDDEILCIVNKLYKSDFELLGYKMCWDKRLL